MSGYAYRIPVIDASHRVGLAVAKGVGARFVRAAPEKFREANP
jgi:hypothetical protein